MRAGTELQSLDATEGPSEDEYDDDEEPGWTERLDAAFGQRWQRLLDLSVPYLGRRWAISALFALTYCTRVYMIQGWYIVTYGLAIYQLSLLIGFLTPQVRAARVAGWEQRGLRCARGEPGGEQTCASGVSVGSAPELPAPLCVCRMPARGVAAQVDPEAETPEGELAVPLAKDGTFMRTIPEFKYWYRMTKAFAIAFGLTFFEVFNVPVSRPVLILYFLMLLVQAGKRQIEHMIRYKYLPCSMGPKKGPGARRADAAVAV